MTLRSAVLALALILIAAALSACGGTAAPTALTPIEISLGYIPDVQFAPFYVGIEKGFFAARGIDLTIQHRQETDSARLLATGALQFAVISGEQVLLGRQQGLPLVYVYQWYERFPVAVAARQSSGIQTVEDLRGRSVGVPVREGASYIGLEALLAAGGLTDADIDLRTTGYAQVETLATDQVEAVVVYAANEPAQLEARGIPVNLIYVADAADLVGNGLVTNEQTLAANPDLVRAMAAALDESLSYTIEHPDEAFEIATGFVEGLSDPEVAPVARQVLARSIDLWRSDTPGQSDPASWQAMQDVLLDMGLLTALLDLDAVYSNEYLP
jgi:NitT/TauT family transport system substrate-binding protein